MERGVIQRIVIDVRYENGTEKQTTLHGSELERLAMLVMKGEAIGRYLHGMPDHARARRQWERGVKEEDTALPAMMMVYDDETYNMRCDPSSHHPPSDD